ncbi:amino acid/amide ABC transporter ATP-binding protein 1 (HAAT family) [Ilumatobacter fluminis]|uniref:Amino acid/amide ABC transporter ATP-binding protein 1 (HAAT family) n=1 Tax=Ilumatobacter fluminis TaxID=467091 RepID=A0A4R7I468_9ACTN|nr:ABC transporter ATP-binding protein [Ilumatobacter fluminis]TDT18285.1 amino acid/amide ABC transporter ATP-binding protein 1 (HAAT family) [Ilumatobacter fluminis]
MNADNAHAATGHAQATHTVDADSAALDVRGLSKTFGGLRAVDDLSFRVPPQSIFGLLGPNGAGKTTVLNLISGLIKPDHGSITVFGDEIAREPAHRVARAGVARTYQNVRLFPALTVLETVMTGFYQHRQAQLWHSVLCLPSERRERREVAERARELLDRVGVTAPPERLAEALPYGEQRRVEIARALATQPKVLMLDEPTAGMNDVESESLGQLMFSLREEGISLVLIEHNVKLVLKFCSDAAVINFGELIAEGDPRACVEDPDVQAAYFGKQSDAERLNTVLRVRGDHGTD